MVRDEIFCGYISETGELGYMILSTNKKNEVFMVFKNFYDFRYSSVKVSNITPLNLVFNSKLGCLELLGSSWKSFY